MTPCEACESSRKPTNAIQSELNDPLKNPTSMNSPTTPKTISAAPISCPIRAAQRVERYCEPVMRQIAARSTRPPSSGKPGSMLKIASAMLMKPSQAISSSRGDPLEPIANQTPMKTAPISRLVSGPTTAIRNSWPGRCESSLISETPPKRKSVMLATSIP